MSATIHHGYVPRIEFDPDDEIFVGRIAGIDDIVGFHSDSIAGLEAAFRDAVDDYLWTCRTIGKMPNSPPPSSSL